MSNTSGAPPPTNEPEPSAPSQPSSQAPPPAAPSSQVTSAPPPAQDTSSAPPPAAPSSSTPPPPAPAPSTSSREPPQESTTSSAPPPQQSTSAPPTSSSESSAQTSAAPSSEAPTSSEQTSAAPESSEPPTSILTITSGQSGTQIVVITSTRLSEPPSTSSSGTPSTGGAGTIDSSNGSSGGGLSKGATVAIGVVVPIAAIAILAIAGLFFWKKRRSRMQAEEERRKEVEDYSYNPNADPTIPSVAMMSDNGYEMREDSSSGYRGWGNTVAGSTGRKASTTISGGVPYSDATSPTYANASEARSAEPLMDSPHSGEGEILGAMGPSAANNRGGDVHRGPSNASSSYSAAGRSDGSDGPVGMAYGSGGYYDSYSQNPYSDNPYGGSRPQEAPGAPVIRDNPARRNTRIESPSHYPQGSVGISQNF